MKIVLSVLLLAALSVATTTSRVEFAGASGERSNATPHGWTVTERTPRDAPMRLSFAVKLRNTDEAVRTLDAVSDPRSSRYGQHLSLEQVDAMTAPAAADVERVVAWLRDEGVQEIDVAGGYVRAHVNAELAERLVACEFRRFHHARTGAAFARCATSYSLPAHVAAVVDFVGGTRHLPNMEHRLDVQMNRARAKTAAAARSTNVEVKKKRQAPLVVTPKSLRARYGMGTTAGSAANNSVCVLGFLGQYFSTLDLGEFYTLFYPELLGSKVNVIGKQPGLPGVEAELDIQYVTAMAAKINATFWSNPAKVANNEPFLDWAQEAAKTADLPLVISVSYGETEYGNELAYVQRMDAEFVNLGNRGVSLIFASGDSGVGCDPTNHFGPDFPATAPHVTSVGAAGGDSVAVFSSGGFSNFFGRQSWQAGAVASYLSQSGLPPAHYYNATGRGFPDVAAQGENFLVVVDLLPEPVDGTSCAAPTFAGIFALLNDLRLNAGKAPLGFLNFVLYQNQAAMIDITAGSNPGSNFCGVGGFPAKQGWDPATGIGEPHYQKWATVVKQLP